MKQIYNIRLDPAISIFETLKQILRRLNKN